MPINYQQMNVSMTDEDIKKVDLMAVEDGIDNRSPFMRKLVRAEWVRRHPEENATGAECPEAEF